MVEKLPSDSEIDIIDGACSELASVIL